MKKLLIGLVCLVGFVSCIDASAFDQLSHDPFSVKWMSSIGPKKVKKSTKSFRLDQKYKLQGVYLFGAVRKAVISGQVVKVGDRLGSYWVYRIGKSDVELNHVSGKSRLRLTFS